MPPIAAYFGGDENRKTRKSSGGEWRSHEPPRVDGLYGVRQTDNDGTMKSIKGATLALMVMVFVGRAEPLQIMTVSGPVAVGEVGVVLSHEHVLVDFVGASEAGPHRYEVDAVVAKAEPFIREAQARGVELMIEATPQFLGRDPRVLLALRERTGMQFITNTGLYGAVRDKFLPDYAWTDSAEQLAVRWVEEANSGIMHTGVKPGFMKLAVDSQRELSEVDAKLVRAGALAHRETGLTIAVHTGRGANLAQLDILAEEGVAASAWVWVHAQNVEVSNILAAAERGAWLSFDGVRPRSLDRHVEVILAMREAGYLNQVLISHDAGWYDPAEPEGGEYRGHVLLFDELIPRLKEAGLTAAEIERLVRHNPLEAFAVRKRLLE